MATERGTLTVVEINNVGTFSFEGCFFDSVPGNIIEFDEDIVHASSFPLGTQIHVMDVLPLRKWLIQLMQDYSAMAT